MFNANSDIMKTTENNKMLIVIGLSFIALAGDEGNSLYQEVAARLLPTPAPAVKEGMTSEASDYAFGIRGLSDYLHVSVPVVQKYVNEGVLDPAIRKVGRKYAFNKAKVDEIFALNARKK